MFIYYFAIFLWFLKINQLGTKVYRSKGSLFTYLELDNLDRDVVRLDLFFQLYYVIFW